MSALSSASVKRLFWVPPERIPKRAKRNRGPYDLSVKQGYIEVTEGNVVDYDVIRMRINGLAERYNIKEITIDRRNATQLATQLFSDGFTVLVFGQRYTSMSGPCRQLERRILGHEINHGHNPLRWMASNVSVITDPAGNMKADKAKRTERIDGVVASLMALAGVTDSITNASAHTLMGLHSCEQTRTFQHEATRIMLVLDTHHE